MLRNAQRFIHKPLGTIFMNYNKKHTKHGSLSGASLVQETELTNFINFLGNEFDEIKYSAKTKDGTSINFDSLKELLDYPNFSKRNLVEMEILCAGEQRSIDISFKTGMYFIIPETITYYLAYDDSKWGFKFEDDLLQELKEFKPYYSPLTYLNLTFGIPLILVGIVILYFSIDYFLKIFGLQGYLQTNVSIEKNTLSSGLIGYIYGALLIFLGYLLNVSRNYLFPILFIATGKQKKEYQFRKKISYFAFGVVLLGVVINVISSLLTNGA